MPVVGFLHAASPEPFAPSVAAFRSGLNESRFIEGQNVAIEYRWAENRYDRLPALAADLIARRVAVLVAPGDIAPAAAKGRNLDHTDCLHRRQRSGQGGPRRQPQPPR